MNADLILTGLALIALTGAFYFLAWPILQKRLVINKPFPKSWMLFMQDRLPLYKMLPNSQQQELKKHIQWFLHKKQFIGCAGLTVTDEMRVTIAAQACLLLLNRRTHAYAKLRYIYIYPSTFRAVQEVRNEMGLVSTQSRDMLGESWSTGKVVLAWDNVEFGVRNFNDGYNVVLHEFAHQLDQESGSANGAPLLYTRAAYKSWAYIFGREFEKLQKRSKKKKTIIDEYGATNPAEFFAVATETFFEEPNKLHKHHQELFEELKNYYQLDPREWRTGT